MQKKERERERERKRHKGSTGRGSRICILFLLRTGQLAGLAGRLFANVQQSVCNPRLKKKGGGELWQRLSSEGPKAYPKMKERSF